MSRTNKNTLKYSMAYPLFVSLLLISGAGRVLALPQNGAVVGGNASISSGASQMDVAQASQRAILDWSSFDIAAGERVNFHQPSAQAVALNRVVGSKSASQIFGALNANGNVIIVNSRGVVFGAGAQVNVGGLVATSSDIADDRFMAGDLTFDRAGSADAVIRNDGSIIADAGLVALAGPSVMNNGLIQAKLGKVALASGDSFAVDLYGDGLIQLQASDALREQIVSNNGQIVADGGDILMTAAAAQNVVNSVINTDGLLQANAVGEKNGRIVLTAAGDKGTALVAGKVSASGGSVDVLAHNVGVLSGASVDVSGQGHGGTIRVGGDYQGKGTTQVAAHTVIQSDASLKANAGENGNGGKVIVWGTDSAVFAGDIEARGGAQSGNGGFVETSGAVLDAIGTVDAGASHGAVGQWLLDPYSITISSDSNRKVTSTVDTVTKSVDFTPTDYSSNVWVGNILKALNNGTSVTVSTTAPFWSFLGAGNITVLSSFTKTAGGNASLILNAHNDIVFAKGVKVSSTSNALNLFLNADTDHDGKGFVRLDEKVRLSTRGGDVVMRGAGISFESDSAVNTQGGRFTADSSLSFVMNQESSIVTGGGNVSVTGFGESPFIGGISLDGAMIDADAGSIQLEGTGFGNPLFGASYGIRLVDSSLYTDGSGSILLSGRGGESGASVLAVNNYGVLLEESRLLNSGNGMISVFGFGGDNVNFLNVNNFGVKLSETLVRSDAGNISIQGRGGNNLSVLGLNNHGVILDEARIEGHADNDIRITGVSGQNRNLFGSDTFGLLIRDKNLIGGRSGVPSVMAYSEGEGMKAKIKPVLGYSGDISFVADTMSMSGRMLVETLGDVSFKPYSAKTTVGVAGAAGTLQVTSPILDSIRAGSISIGDGVNGAGLISANDYMWRSDVNFYNNSGSIVFNGQQELNSNRLLAFTRSGNIEISKTGGIRSSASGDAIVLAASGGHFLNGSGSDALDVSGKARGRWLIYSKNPSGDQMDGLTSDFRRYSCTYLGTCPSFAGERGNGNLYAFTPMLTLTPTPFSMVYGATYYTDLAYDLLGYLPGDKALDVVTGGVSYGSNYWFGADVGSYNLSVTNDSLVSKMGYGFTPGTTVVKGGLTITPASLTVTADAKSKVYGSADPSLTFAASGFVYEDTQDGVLSGGLTRVAGEHVATGPYAILQGSLMANKNYTISFVGADLTITPASLSVVAANKTMKYGAALPPLTYSYNGLVNGDTDSVFGGALATTGSSTATFADYPITQGSLTAGADYDITFEEGTLTILSPADEIMRAVQQGEAQPGGARRLGYNGVLLSMSRSPLGGLAPAAGGNPSTNLTPADLANLSPAAGGNGPLSAGMSGGTMALIECNDDAPCMLNQ